MTQKISDYNYFFKILLVGDGNVGKSAMMERFVSDKWNDTYITTRDQIHKEKYIYLNENTIKLQIWDIERLKMVYRGAQGIMVVYDCTDQNSFINIRRWLSDIERYACENVNILLVGNKIDLNDQKVVSNEDVKLFIEDLNFFNLNFIEVSAKINLNIEQCFVSLSNDILNRHIENSEKTIQKTINNKPKKKSSPCLNQSKNMAKNNDIWNKFFGQYLYKRPEKLLNQFIMLRVVSNRKTQIAWKTWELDCNTWRSTTWNLGCNTWILGIRPGQNIIIITLFEFLFHQMPV
ncbi:hypothetical protein ACTA71_004639 [Dictyostelium dimigraforme]